MTGSSRAEHRGLTRPDPPDMGTTGSHQPASVPSALYWSCAILLLLPIWLPQYLPTEDGFAHLYWIEMYRWLADPGTAAAHLFTRHVAWDTPHQLLYFGLQYALGSVLEPHLAQKVVISAAVVFWAGAIWFLSRAATRDLSLGAFAALLLIHSSWLYNGFFAFVGALPLVLVELGVLARLADDPAYGGRARPYILVGALGIVAHYAHFMVGALFMMLGGLWLIFPWRPLRVRRAWLALALLPLGSLQIWYFTRGTLGSGGAQWESVTRAAARFFGLAFFRGFAGPTVSYWLALAAFAGVTAFLCWRGIRADSFGVMPQSRRFILLFAGLLAVSYFFAPVAIGEAYPFNGRLQYAGIAWLLPSLPSPFPARTRVALLTVVTLLLGWQVATYGGRAVRLSRSYERVLRQAEAIPVGAKLVSSVQYDSARYEGSFIRVLASVPEDIALRRRGYLLNSFFSPLPFYWVRSRAGGSGPPDYRLDLRSKPDGRIDLIIRRP